MTFATQPATDKREQLWTKVNASGVEYQRLPLHTRWLDETDDLALALKEHLRLAQQLRDERKGRRQYDGVRDLDEDVGVHCDPVTPSEARELLSVEPVPRFARDDT